MGTKAKMSKRAKLRKSLSKPADRLSASEKDTRRELIASGRAKTSPGAKRKKAKSKRVRTAGGVAKALRSRGRL